MKIRKGISSQLLEVVDLDAVRHVTDHSTPNPLERIMRKIDSKLYNQGGEVSNPRAGYMDLI